MEATVDVQAVDPPVFYATGKQPAGAAPARLWPAALAPYRDLANLRFDFPLILTSGKAGAPVISLSDAVNAVLQEIAPPGRDGETLRRTVLRIERAVRKRAAGGAKGTLSEMWAAAAANLEEAARSEAQKAWAALGLDGTVLDCHQGTAAILMAHLWSAAQNEKARQFLATAAKLSAALSGILRADYLRSAEGRSPQSLQAAMGGALQSLFDFSEMSALLPKATARDALPESRRRRLAWALAVLEQQRFFAVPGKAHAPANEPYGFRFDNCGEALAAYRARLPELTELVKAMAVAELEIDGAYNEGRHDAYFSGFDAGSLRAEDRARFPDYLLVLGDESEPFDNTGVLAVLSSGIPLKIVLNVGDLATGDDPAALGVRSTDIATLAAALGNVFVLQSAGSNLYALHERLSRGLAFAGPALFSVYAPPATAHLPAYLAAAAAMQSRAFPAFTYDPGAGSDLASRFSLENNPQPEADWTTSVLEYADGDLQRVRQEVAFTFVDFLACDPRQLHHFAVAPAGYDRLAPAAEAIGVPSRSAVPFVAVSDADNRLARLIADERAVDAARRCLEKWHRLQELGGVHNSHAERLLERERKAWEERAPQASAAEAAPPSAPVAVAEAPVTEAPAEVERAPGDAFIETPRCSSCNECTQINSRMFAYNGDKQAYIADVKAGSFAQLVEAAENCQIGIIHPGKPVNLAESGLEALIERAGPFQ
ncbi:MAG: hypothetical protein KGJ78_12535 [Alphaproteobacteria bacterium]|nr:hypothetical protein [Alphaproteobacteria bacterium]